ncbi:MAG: hypothetical protein LBJ67_02275 [Planctomycetaceae bacterium]|jgi:hypothetical protein|nr:hypothetical protein [Planctomycetaceae bacterium]
MRLYSVIFLFFCLTGTLSAQINGGNKVRFDNLPLQIRTEPSAELNQLNNKTVRQVPTFVQFETPAVPVEQPAVQFETPAVPFETPDVQQPINDPFQYQTSDGNIMVPSKSTSLPQGIQLVGVLIMEDKNLPPVAAIKMPNFSGGVSRQYNTGIIHYVREREMLEVHRSMLNARPTARPQKSNDEQPEMLFLEIYKITPYQIEVRSKDNFEDKHIIR